MIETAKASGTKRPLRIGMVGAGMISHHHLIAWSREPRAVVVAIGDPNLARAQKRASEFGITAAYDGLASLLAAQEVDALDIASPRETHAALVDMAAERSIDVLCQKPLTPTLAEAEALARRIDGRIRLMVHENWRFRPWYRALKCQIDGGALGDLRWAGMATISSGLLSNASGNRPALERQPFMAHEKRLAISEVLIHHIDVMRWLLGPLKLLSARTAHKLAEVEGETLASLFLETADGAPITVIGDMAAPGFPPRTDDRLEVAGCDSSAVFDRSVLTLMGAVERTEPFDFHQGYQESFDGVIRHFVDRLIDGSSFETDVTDNLETLRIVEQAYAAASRSGRPS
jgi:D-apiose dehydrogenase